jgi:hypothetical protein
LTPELAQCFDDQIDHFRRHGMVPISEFEFSHALIDGYVFQPDLMDLNLDMITVDSFVQSLDDQKQKKGSVAREFDRQWMNYFVRAHWRTFCMKFLPLSALSCEDTGGAGERSGKQERKQKRKTGKRKCKSCM